jgi:hypothetical protein
MFSSDDFGKYHTKKKPHKMGLFICQNKGVYIMPPIPPISGAAAGVS